MTKKKGVMSYQLLQLGRLSCHLLEGLPLPSLVLRLPVWSLAASGPQSPYYSFLNFYFIYLLVFVELGVELRDLCMRGKVLYH